MKTKKIVSLLASVSIIASSFVAFATIASAADKPTFNIEYTPVDFTGEYAQYKGDFDWSEYGDNYETYHITVKATGIELQTTVAGKTKKLSGTSINAAEIDVVKTTDGVQDEDYTMGLIKTLYSSPTKSQTKSKFSVAYASAEALYPAPKTALTVTKDDVTDSLFEFLITVDKTKPVTLSFENGKIKYATFENDVTVANSTQTLVPVMSPASITLPASSTVDVTGVSIKDKADFTLDLNGEKTKTLEAVVAPADATNTEVKWSSDNEKAATVVDGKVTAVGEGEAKITVTTVDGGFTDSVKVTVKDTTPPEKSIVDVTPSEITGDYGTKTLKHIANIVKNADATAFIKVTKTLNGNTESKTTTQTIAELLGGVANDGALITADVAIGVLTADTDAVFSFGLVK